jgi:hypothetical protein
MQSAKGYAVQNLRNWNCCRFDIFEWIVQKNCGIKEKKYS